VSRRVGVVVLTLAVCVVGVLDMTCVRFIDDTTTPSSSSSLSSSSELSSSADDDIEQLKVSVSAPSFLHVQGGTKS